MVTFIKRTGSRNYALKTIITIIKKCTHLPLKINCAANKINKGSVILERDDSVTGSSRPSDLKQKLAQSESVIINLIIYTCGFPALVGQCFLCLLSNFFMALFI